MKTELETFRREMDAVFVRTETLLAGLSDEQCGTKPAPGAWSISECLDHLTLTAKAYHPTLETYLRKGVPAGGAGYTPGWLGRWFVGYLEPPVKRGFKAPAPFVPADARRLGEVKSDFLAAHEFMLSRLDALDRLDLGRIRIESPFAKWVSYPLGLVFYILPAHCRRHLWQAERVRQIVAPSGGRI